MSNLTESASLVGEERAARQFTRSPDQGGELAAWPAPHQLPAREVYIFKYWATDAGHLLR